MSKACYHAIACRKGCVYGVSERPAQRRVLVDDLHATWGMSTSVCRPPRVTCFPIFGPFEVRKFSVRFSTTNRGRGDETIEVQRPANCIHIALGGGRDTSRRGVPQGGDLTSDLLPLATDVGHNYRGPGVVDVLERVTGEYGKPKTIRVDQGPEFVSKTLDLWAYLNGVTLDFSRAGKPQTMPSLSRSMDRSGPNV